MTEYKIGDSVASKKCRQRYAFTGLITFVGVNGKDETYYHVTDDEGVEWHRDPSDLSPLYANDNAPLHESAAA